VGHHRSTVVGLLLPGNDEAFALAVAGRDDEQVEQVRREETRSRGGAVQELCRGRSCESKA
jgi:hypothetical protein